MPSINPITAPLTSKQAAHLLRRATFGPSKADITAFTGKTITEAMDVLFVVPSAQPAPPIDLKTGKTWLNPKAVEDVNSKTWELIPYFKAWFLEQMRASGNTIAERLTYWLHTHLPLSVQVVQSSEAAYYQNALYRYYAMGSFKDMFQKLINDNAMLVYLDGTLNDYGSPNENFAREMMELYSIGKGPQAGPGDYTNYTENDIREAARVLTGFNHDTEFTNLDTETKLPQGKLTVNRHDPGEKKFSARFANTIIKPNEVIDGLATEVAVYDEIKQLIDMIFAQDETARFLCRKLYRFFVYYKITPEVEQDIIVPMAQTLKSNNYQIQLAVKQLLSSEHFFDLDTVPTADDHIGALIKSPIDLTIGTLRAFGLTPPPADTQLEAHYNAYAAIQNMIFDQGLTFYTPFEVAGYTAYHQLPDFNRYWITPNNLAYRYQLISLLIKGTGQEGMPDIQLDIVQFVKDNISDPSNAATLVKELVEIFFAVEVKQERLDFFKNNRLLDGQPDMAWNDEWGNYIASGNDMTVRMQLERLIRGVLETPEYQLF